jgi:iron complex transport system ATP-binding protein
MTAFTLAALGRHPHTDWSGRMTQRDLDVVRWAMDAVGASALAHRNLGELSDGERQKVMIARALAQESTVIVLDEPTAFLDLPRRVEIMSLLRRLARTTGRAILLSTHDLDLALRSADRILVMQPGAPLQAGAPEDLVLGGVFQRIFRDTGVEFDSHTGSFRIHGAGGGEVLLKGEGVHAIWTQRALEREGYRVTRRTTDPHADQREVRVDTRDGRPLWRLTVKGRSRELHSLYDLTSCMRKQGS